MSADSKIFLMLSIVMGLTTLGWIWLMVDTAKETKKRTIILELSYVMAGLFVPFLCVAPEPNCRFTFLGGMAYAFSVGLVANWISLRLGVTDVDPFATLAIKYLKVFGFIALHFVALFAMLCGIHLFGQFLYWIGFLPL